MRIARYLVIPVLLVAILGCGLGSGLQQLQQAVTQMPNALNSMPTAMEAMSTMAAGPGPAANATPSAGGLNISLDDVKKIETSGRYSFTDTAENGQPVSTAVLTDLTKSEAPGVGDKFSARFIGNPANLNQILVTVPATQDPATAFEEIGLIGDVLSSGLSTDTKSSFTLWLTQSYTALAPGSEKQTTIQNLQFTLKESQTEITLEVDPAP
jgi:hypothetical protein